MAQIPVFGFNRLPFGGVNFSQLQGKGTQLGGFQGSQFQPSQVQGQFENTQNFQPLFQQPQTFASNNAVPLNGIATQQQNPFNMINRTLNLPFQGAQSLFFNPLLGNQFPQQEQKEENSDDSSNSSNVDQMKEGTEWKK